MEMEFNNIAARPLVMALLGIEAKCRKCGADLSPASAKTFREGGRVKCSAGCGWYGIWRDNTVLSGSRINNMQFLALFFKYTLPNDAPGIAEKLNLTSDTIRAWRERIITSMRAA